MLEDQGFEVVNGGSVDSEVDSGLVAYSSPGSGTNWGAGDEVVIYVSTGRDPDRNRGGRGNRGNNGNNGRGGRG
ncbi:PASTA domain-containing protein [Nocardioides sp. TF02-7]|uniref:PASTA domain-containing protein n=1 Tax=Nocardioides sp. TF02-7 TaxID=2917724 RepID=UPI001F0586AC|nr:PASTA domain-containing protein [Nocardioides sp. TF02-7]UMG94726.1 PASTA domain-containing protein [Nocardioides sp. TF02-7]